MALVHIQSMLAKIYTDAELRQRFLLNPYAVATAHNLEDSDIEQIVELSKPQVEDFAVSLIYKRLGETRKKLSSTARVLGKKFPRLFFQYAKNSSPQGVKKHLKDALLFAQYIERVAVKEEVASWAVDIMRYEINGMKAFLSPFTVSVAVFHYDVEALNKAMLRNDQVQPTKRLRVSLWVKYWPNKRMFHKVF